MATPNINHPTGNTNSNNSTPLQSNTTLATVDIAAAVDVATMIASQVADTVVKETIKKAVNEIIQQEKFPKPSERLQRIAEPSVNSYLNLYNNHRSVLGPDKVLRLEQKLAELRKYSQVIADDLKVLIVDKTNGITPKQGTLLQTKILEILENFVSSNQDTEVPRFLETSYGFKSLKVVCANAYTLKWLKETIAKLKPEPWKGARLEVTFMSTYSVYSTVSNRPTTKSKPTDGRVKFAIPKTTKTVTFDEIKKQIEIHNVPVKTVSWKELHKIEKPAYTMYFVSMNKESIDEIRTKGNRLFYLLGTIKFAPLNQNDEIAYNEMIIAAKKKVAADKRAAAAKTGTAGPGAPANPGAGNVSTP